MAEDSELAELIEMISHREASYRFLSRLYEKEVDAELLDQMRRMDLSVEEGPSDLIEGYRLLKRYLEKAGETAAADLAAQFARIFLGGGPREGDGAFPYESVYRSPERLMMQEAREQVARIFDESGVGRATGCNLPEDHIALELAFMAHLCRETFRALEANDADAARALLVKQDRFLGERLLTWAAAFSADVERLATNEFYKGVARITVGYLAMDRDLIGGLQDAT